MLGTKFRSSARGPLSHLSNADSLHSLAMLLCPVLFIILSVWILLYYFWLFWIQICWSCSSLQKTSSLLLWFLILFFYSPFHRFLPKCLFFFYLLLLDLSCLGFSKTLKCIISCFLVVCLIFICKHSNISTSLLESYLLYLKVSDKLCFHFHFLLWILKLSPVCFVWPDDHSRWSRFWVVSFVSDF